MQRALGFYKNRDESGVVSAGRNLTKVKIYAIKVNGKGRTLWVSLNYRRNEILHRLHAIAALARRANGRARLTILCPEASGLAAELKLHLQCRMRHANARVRATRLYREERRPAEVQNSDVMLKDRLKTC